MVARKLARVRSKLKAKWFACKRNPPATSLSRVTRHSESVTTERRGDVGLVIVDNPPVNAISDAVREGIHAAALELGADATVAAIVLHCAGGTFMAGADIRRLANRKTPALPTVEIIGALERVRKPSIAALQGNALGGGLEFALGCHYRCAAPRTQLGLPEVNLGLIPGAGGTQRLPRLAGLRGALRIIVSGKPISAAEALELGLVDAILPEGDVLSGAIDYARELVRRGAPPRPTRERIVDREGAEAALGEALALATKTRKSERAPLAAIDAVRASIELDFDSGVAKEAELFAQCRNDPQSRALRHLFVAERQVGKLATGTEVAPRAIGRVAVVGGGTMGRGIAMAVANAGLPVTLIESSEVARQRALEGIESAYQASVSRGRLDEATRDEALARLRSGTALELAAEADLVIEAVFEDLPLKRSLFGRLDALCRPGAILATNTSALDIDRIAEATRRPADVVGLHFFSPAHVMRLLEIVRGAQTSVEVLASSLAFGKRLRKLGVVAGNCDGFIGNRMLNGYRREAEFLLLEGATPAQVDAALVAFGFPMGPFTMGDMAGLDVSAAGRQRRRAEGKLPADERFGAVPDRLVEAGRHGQKTGAGYYRYEKGSHAPSPDPEAQALIEREARRLGIGRREIGDAEIVMRCVLPLVNEGARIVEEGIAQRPGDVDVVWVNGYGFPRVRGGPMCHADEVGLAGVLSSLEQLAREQGELYWAPAPLIAKLAAQGQAFSSLN